MVAKNDASQDIELNTNINIAITVYNWTRLNSLKRPGESFNTVIHRLLDEKEATSS